MIRKYSAPGIYKQEIDVSDRVSPAGTSTGATVVRAKKGPINTPFLVTSDAEYIDYFGEPVNVSGTVDDSTIPEMDYGAYGALEFLKESSALYVVRDYASGDQYASVLYDSNGSTSATSADGIDCISDTTADNSTRIYTLDEAIPTGKSLMIGPLGPGSDGNNLAVTLESFHASCDWINNYDTYTSATTAASHPIGSKVFKLQLYTKEDNESWTTLSFANYSASPVETFYGTRTSMQDASKNQLSIADRVNGISQYIYVVPGSTDFATTGAATGCIPTSVTALQGGAVVNGTNIGSTDGWSWFANREDVDVNIMIVPDYTNSVKQYVANLAAARQDCIAVGQTGSRTVVSPSSIIAMEDYGYNNPSYMSLYAGWGLMQDTYNDKTVWVPNSIFGAALMARTDRVATVWDAPAGINRGILPVLRQYTNFTSTNVGVLYDSNINAAKKIKGIGNVMWGQKTAQLKASALDRINVRRMLLYMEESIEQSMLTFLFQPNNSSTRLRVWSIIDGFVQTIQAGGGIDTYQVVCDDSNNTAEVIDNNQLWVDTFVNPTKTIEYIQLRTIITRSGVSFSEISV